MEVAEATATATAGHPELLGCSPPTETVNLSDLQAPSSFAWLSAMVIPICIAHSIPIDHEHLLSHDAVNYGRPLSICLAD